MTSPSSGYRAVCRLCKTVLVSSMPHGRFQTVDEALKVIHAHLIHRCECADEDMKRHDRDVIADNSIEAIEGAA